MDGLKRLTGGTVSWNITRPIEGFTAVPPMPRNRTFSGGREILGPDGE